MLKRFSPSIRLSRRGHIFMLAGYDNTLPTPEATFFRADDAKAPADLWIVTLPQVNSLLESGDIALAS